MSIETIDWLQPIVRQRKSQKGLYLRELDVTTPSNDPEIED